MNQPFVAAIIACCCLAWMPGGSIQAGPVILETGQMLMLRDAKETQYGAVKAERLEPSRSSIVFRWFLLPENTYDLSSGMVRSGTVEVVQIKKRAVISFGPFVLEWHGGAGEKGIISVNDSLGTQPLFIATSGIHDPSKIRDVREGFKYVKASQNELPAASSLEAALADLPRARLGLAVVDTLVKDENGLELASIRVSRVDLDSKAFEAGIRENQEVIAFNGVDIFSADDFHEQLKKVKPDTQVTLTILENRESREIAFLAEARIPVAEKKVSTNIPPNQTPEQRKKSEQSQEVMQMMQNAVDALRAVHFD